MDAVKAHSEIDHTDSIAHNTDDFNVETDPDDIELINALAYLDGAPIEEVFENADIAEYTDEHILAQLEMFLKESSNDGIGEDVTDLLPDDVSSGEFQAAAEDQHFTEEQLRTIIEVQSRITTFEDVKSQEREMATQILDHPLTAVVIIVVGFAQTTTVVISNSVSVGG